MKFRVIVFIMVSIVVFYCASVFAAEAQGSKVGVINMQKVVTDSKAGKDAKIQFDKYLESQRAVVAAKEKSIKADDDDLKANGAKMKADLRKAKEDKLAQDIKEIKRLDQDMRDELKKKDMELTSGIVNDLQAIIKKVGEEGKYSVIIQGTPQILYIDKVTDITDEVLKRYDSGK